MSQVRQSISCMIAGLMTVGPIVVWFAPWQEEGNPHKIVLVSLVTISIIGIMILFDELRTLLTLQREQSQRGRH